MSSVTPDSVLKTANTLLFEETTNVVRNLTNAFNDLPDVVRLSEEHTDPPSNISTALCYKAIFGKIDLGLILQWVAYHQILGFDHREEVSHLPRFEELANLSYVTLSPHQDGTIDDHYGQRILEERCLADHRYAASFDWAMVADSDEYLWFREKIGVKEFLGKCKRMKYLSFGKWMYTLDHHTDMTAGNYRLDSSKNGFVLSNYPFTAKAYCFDKPHKRGRPVSPTWRGRSKLIVRPKYHTRLDVHGIYYPPRVKDGALHVHADDAHFKEGGPIPSQNTMSRGTRRKILTHSLKLKFASMISFEPFLETRTAL